MSTIELAPQKPKEYNDHNVRKQDHGDATEQKALRRSPYGVERRERIRAYNDAEYFEIELANREDVNEALSKLSPAQLEQAANKILREDGHFSTETPGIPTASEEDSGHYDTYTEEELDVFEAKDRFFTPEDFGLRSRHEIRLAMGQRAAEDAAYDEDDNGDSDYNIPVRIKNQL